MRPFRNGKMEIEVSFLTAVGIQILLIFSESRHNIIHILLRMVEGAKTQRLRFQKHPYRHQRLKIVTSDVDGIVDEHVELLLGERGDECSALWQCRDNAVQLKLLD